jgi:hypothetical protein
LLHDLTHAEPNVKERLEGLGAVIAADRGTPEYLARLAQLAR